MSETILVVDDEPPIVEMLAYNLKRAHYRVIVASDGRQALDLAQSEQPDLIVLDLMLPEVDGLDVCRELRKTHDVPIIMLTARDAEVDRVVGLELGADDYVVKPFSVRELMARIKSVLRRAGRAQDGAPPGAVKGGSLVRAGPLTVDSSRYEARWQTHLLDLTTQEFQLLLSLAQHTGQVLSREQLLNQVWGYEYYGDLRVVDAAVKRLRAKLRMAAPETAAIETVRGVGYKLTL